MISYPAVIEFDREDGVYNVNSLDLPGCLTVSKNLSIFVIISSVSSFS